jgi:hypothetical protein
MMPDIRVSESTFKRLQTLAEPFVDNPEAVIAKLLDHYDSTHGPRSARHETSDLGENIKLQPFSPANPPDLTHTRLLRGEIDGVEVTNWNELADVTHRAAMKRLQSREKLIEASKSQIVIGRKNDQGFHYLDDIEVSIQGVAADYAWRNSLHLARLFKLAIRVEFEWRQKPQAAHPGKRGLLEWSPAAEGS